MINFVSTKTITKTTTQSKSEDKIAKFTNAKALVDVLISLGVDSIFGYPGAAVLSIYNELSKTNLIRHFLVRHEQAAVHAAEGYARISGKVGIVLVTSGPGFTNTVTGIANAYADSTPLVVLAGDVPEQNNCGNVFQKVDILSITKTCSKKNYQLSPKDDIKEVIKEAFEVANSGKKGPVVVVLPRNLLEKNYNSSKQFINKSKKIEHAQNLDLNSVYQKLSKSKNPLLLIGGGAVNSVENIKKFVEITKIPVVSTLMGVGIFPSGNSLYNGMIGINGTVCANTSLNNADLILALGVSFSDRSTCKGINFAPNAEIINVNICKIKRHFDISINCDINKFLEEFIKYLKNKPSININNWHEKFKILKEDCFKKENFSSKLHSSNVIEAIYEYTKNLEPVVVTDVGQHQMITAQHFNFSKPKKFITSGGLGTMGFGLPASIGAYLANPSNLVINITGDGSFQMNLQELATCREHNIPVKIIIMNNGYLGMVRQMQEKIYNKRYQVEMINPDFTKIAEAYDLYAVHVSTAEELIPALKQAISHNGTAIVDIAVDSFEQIEDSEKLKR